MHVKENKETKMEDLRTSLKVSKLALIVEEEKQKKHQSFK